MGCNTSTAFDHLAFRPCHVVTARVPSITGTFLGCVVHLIDDVVLHHHAIDSDLNAKSCVVRCPFSFHLAILASVMFHEEKVIDLLQHSCSSLSSCWEEEFLTAAVCCS